MCSSNIQGQGHALHRKTLASVLLVWYDSSSPPRRITQLLVTNINQDKIKKYKLKNLKVEIIGIHKIKSINQEIQNQ